MSPVSKATGNNGLQVAMLHTVRTYMACAGTKERETEFLCTCVVDRASVLYPATTIRSQSAVSTEMIQ